MAKRTGKDCSWWEQADSRVSNRERGKERWSEVGPASRRGGKNVCVKEHKREIKRGGGTDKKGAGGDFA